jgi:hypothetical protein
VKDNQLTLCRNVAAVCAASAPLSTARSVDAKRRNRYETRTVSVFAAVGAVAGSEWAPHVAALIRVRRRVLTYQPATGLWKTSDETSFYLSNRPCKAALAASAIRQHWAIENSFHYVRDVTFREDASRIRTNPGIFARLVSFAFNILRFNQSGSIAQDRYAAALGGFEALNSIALCNEN